jgi:hypothetical protein
MSGLLLPDNPFAPGPPKSRPRRKVYSVPRRYDLATLMAVTFAYALLFGGMRFWEFPPLAVGGVSLFVTLVGLGQAVLFRGRRPRAASAVMGILGFSAVLAWIVISNNDPISLPAAAIYSSIWGTILGYLAGVLVAGVFLIAELIRRLLRRLSTRKPAVGIDWADATVKATTCEPAGPPATCGPVVRPSVAEPDATEV